METNQKKLASVENPHLKQYDASSVELILRSDFTQQNADTFAFQPTRMDGIEGAIPPGPDNYATNFMGTRTTYGQINAEIDRTARALRGFGIGKGDFVSVLMPNVKEIIVYTYALWRIGAVACLMDPRTNAEGILERIKRAGSRLLITLLDVSADKVDPIIDRLPFDTVVVVSPGDSLNPKATLKCRLGKMLYQKKEKSFMEARPGSKYIRHPDFIAAHNFEGDIHVPYEKDMPAAVVYTSGTSADGLMKGVLHSHASLNAVVCSLYCNVRPVDYKLGDTFGGFLPFFSSYGLFCGMHMSLCAGFEIILIPIFKPDDFSKIILRDKPNVFLGVPRWYEVLARNPKLAKKSDRLSFVKIPISGGDKISPTSMELVNQALLRNGCTHGLRIGYGASEFGGSLSMMPQYDPTREDFNWKAEGNVGYILPNSRVCVIDPETNEELEYGVDGELCVHSLSMMQEYHNLPKETEEITFIGPDGTKYYRMGDKGHLDENGVFYFVDRYKRSMMRPDGHTVHPAPAENVIMQHEAVNICAVVGLKQFNDSTGVIPTAFVVLKDEYDSPEKQREVLLEIDRLCLKQLPERDKAIAYKAVKEVPYTLMEKINFRELEKEMFVPDNFVIVDFAFFPELRKKK
ncbi:MAG: acyl--CoA ligase [Oscillospiraceae bacterium]|nr:acyl--CoA ligase [Oscillospiraceae bacterium]